MIRMTNWVADIPAEDKRIAYMGEHETCQRQFLLTGEDAARYEGWTFRLDMQFDVSTVTTATTRRTERVEEERERSMSETHDSEQTTTLTESGTVTEVAVDCDSTTDIVYLTQEPCREGLLLTWTVLAQHTRLPGRLWATLRAQNADGAVKKSAVMLFAVDKAVEATPAAVPPLSEFEEMERAMDGRLVALEELTMDAVEAAKTAKANALAVSADKEQTAAYKEQAQTAATTAEAAAKEAVEAADGVHKSAYDVAVDNGFEGTEEEWLASLKGEQGATTEEIDAAAALAADAAMRANIAAENANGAAGGVLTIEQNSGEPLRFWVGTQAEYDALADKDATCFYLISDDKTLENLSLQVDALQGVVVGHGASIGELKSRDYIVEQGESVVGSDTWWYRKWNSGYVECWLRGSAKMAVTTACAGDRMYRTDYIRHALPAGLFEQVRYANVSVIAWDTVGLPHTQIVQASVETGHIQWFLYRLTSTESSEFEYAVEMNGEWK